MNTETKDRVRKSEKLTTIEKKAYDKLVASFDTKIDAAEFFGFSTVTLDAISLKGSGKPSTIAIIRQKINEAA